MTGTVFQDRYEVVGELGQGSFGRVYKARQLSTGQHVALKILQRSNDEDNGTRARYFEDLRCETKLCADLSHPNIVRLIDACEISDGSAYVAFEFVPGTTLKDTLSHEGKLGVAEAVHLMAQVLDALSCAHASGVVHRDLKPENIMVTKTGARRNALVLDFGLGGLASKSRATSSSNGAPANELLGTVCYAAPEQLRGEPAAPHSDLYAWGMTLLECLTGDQPYHGASAQEVILKQLGPGPVAIPEWLRNHPLGRVIEIATAKQVEKRDVPIERLLNMLNASVGESSTVTAGTIERTRRQLTVVCCRLAIATVDSGMIDVDEADQLIETRLATLADRAAQLGGSLAAILADRVLLTFGYPHAREGDIRRAAGFALDVARGVDAPTHNHLRIQIGVGVHNGLVLIRDTPTGSATGGYHLTGLTSQIASQLAESAEPGTVLVSVEAQRLLRREFEVEPVGSETIARPPSTRAVFRLSRQRRTVVAADGTTTAPESPLVGRGPQLQRLLDGWAASGAGQSSITIVTGEPGIGKSRLLQELRQRVGADAWIEMNCAPENQTTPLRPVIDALLAVDQSVESLLTRY
ncbi:MAG TPA: protein kinase, partial [Candidatus Kryptonia bacterium]|nr:protein kinase [Candidatus Kryptonia bacterium]